MEVALVLANLISSHGSLPTSLFYRENVFFHELNVPPYNVDR